MKRNVKPRFFFTYDIGCASALVSVGFELATLDKSNPKKVQFAFTKTDEIEKTAESYWSDFLNVNARTLVNNMKMLKSRIYSD